MKLGKTIKTVSVSITLGVLLGVSLFCGLMIAVAGGAVYPPLVRVAAPVACDGEFTIESSRYSYQTGQSGTQHRVFCTNRESGARAEITFYALFIAFLIYSLIIFVVLAVIIIPLIYITTSAIIRNLNESR